MSIGSANYKTRKTTYLVENCVFKSFVDIAEKYLIGFYVHYFCKFSSFCGDVVTKTWGKGYNRVIQNYLHKLVKFSDICSVE